MAAHTPLGRREFLDLATGSVLATLLAGCASVAARPVTARDGRVVLALADYPELTTPGAGGSAKLLPDGAPDPIYILALDGGEFAALSPICTHLGCTVEIEGTRLVCPCHGSTYDRAGAVLQGPATRSLHRYRTSRTSDGSLVISLGDGS